MLLEATLALNVETLEAKRNRCMEREEVMKETRRGRKIKSTRTHRHEGWETKTR
jgi:hypothetical protein